MDDHDIERLVRETLAPFLGEPMDEEARDGMEAALRAAGVPLDPVDPINLEYHTGDILVRLADGRELRWGDMGAKAAIADRSWGDSNYDPRDADDYDPPARSLLDDV